MVPDDVGTRCGLQGLIVILLFDPRRVRHCRRRVATSSNSLFVLGQLRIWQIGITSSYYAVIQDLPFADSRSRRHRSVGRFTAFQCGMQNAVAVAGLCGP
jgi:hypothetical protein